MQPTPETLQFHAISQCKTIKNDKQNPWIFAPQLFFGQIQKTAETVAAHAPAGQVFPKPAAPEGPGRGAVHPIDLSLSLFLSLAVHCPKRESLFIMVYVVSLV